MIATNVTSSTASNATSGTALLPSTLLVSLHKEGISYSAPLPGENLAGTSVHLCEKDGTKVVLKAITPGQQESMGVVTLNRELRVLEAGLPCLPSLIQKFTDDKGGPVGIVRSYHTGTSVIDLVRNRNLSIEDFQAVLEGLCKQWSERGFVLTDTDASNFIVAAEYGIVNPAALYRCLVLIDPEALSPVGDAIVTEDQDPVLAVTNSLRRQAEQPS